MRGEHNSKVIALKSSIDALANHKIKLLKEI